MNPSTLSTPSAPPELRVVAIDDDEAIELDVDSIETAQVSLLATHANSRVAGSPRGLTMPL